MQFLIYQIKNKYSKQAESVIGFCKLLHSFPFLIKISDRLPVVCPHIYAFEIVDSIHNHTLCFEKFIRPLEIIGQSDLID